MTLQHCGVSIAIQARDLDGATDDELRTLFRETVAYLQPRLREHIGDARPRGELVTEVTGPHSDPFQGLIYVVSLAAPVETDDLPTDCTARKALNR